MSTLPPDVPRLARLCSTALLLLLIPVSALAGPACEHVLKALGNRLADANCLESTNLTTNNPLTTPANNSLPGCRPAFTPQTDRAVIAPSAGRRHPSPRWYRACRSTRASPRTTGQARFPLRLPNDWNGRLVVAGASGTRSEFNGDFVWSDYGCSKVMPTRRRTRAC
jgi:hypothetical protein